MDVYERKARVYPAIASMVIPTLFAIYLFWPDLKDFQDDKEMFFLVLKGIIPPAIAGNAMGFFFVACFDGFLKHCFNFHS